MWDFPLPACLSTWPSVASSIDFSNYISSRGIPNPIIFRGLCDLCVCAAVLEMRLNCWQLRKSLPRRATTTRGSTSRLGSRAPSSIQYQISGLPYAHSLCATFLSPFDFLPFFPLQSYENILTHNIPTLFLTPNKNVEN